MDNMEAMDSALVQEEKKSYSELLGDREVADYKNHLFDLDKFGGKAEADALIERYKSQNIELEDADKQLLIDNAPPAPDFPLMTKEQYNKKSCFNSKQKKYKKNVENYFKARKEFYTAKAKKNESAPKGKVYTELRERIETGEYYKKSEIAKSMDAEFEQAMNNEEMAKLEEQKGKEECDKLKEHSEKNDPALAAALETYSIQGFQDMNNNSRYGFRDPSVESITNYMKAHPLDRDLIVKRAVTRVGTLANMMGIPLKNVDNFSENDIKKMFKDRLKSEKELIISDKGLVSTSLPSARKFFDAGGGDTIGIEFIIKCKKGTAAMNIQSISEFPEEGELLIGANTKFKVVDAQFDGKANILHGHKKSWKIYLETIPESEEGIKRKAA